MKIFLACLMSLVLWVGFSTPASAQDDSAPEAERFDLTGIWESDGGTLFRFSLTGEQLDISLAGDNPRYAEYELELHGGDTPNSYFGAGHFMVSLNDEECRFETQWMILAIADDRLIGTLEAIVPGPTGCEAETEVHAISLVRRQNL